jgi:hypothetical protein
MDDFIEMALKLEADLTTATLEWNEAVERNIEYCGARRS